MEDIIAVAEKDRENKELLVMKNIKKTVIRKLQKY